MNFAEAFNRGYIEAQYLLWQGNPQAVPQEWQSFFAGMAFAGTELQDCTESQKQQAKVEILKHRYRDIGHVLAGLDPLIPGPTEHPLLTLSAVGLSEDDLERDFYTLRCSPTERAPLREIVQILRDTYCRSIGVEFMHLQDPQEREWLQDRMEPLRNRPALDHEAKIRILNKLYQASLFETYLQKKYPGQTRFSLEGAEAVIAMLDALFLAATENGCTEIVLGMPHRGRLNIETNIMYKTYEEVFREFVNDYNPESLVGMGDVKYHNGYFTTIGLANGRAVLLFLADNPSHLESVNPVVEGIVRARQDLLREGPRNQILPLLFHGDAAFAGQGVVAETLNLSQLEGYKTEGTIHIVINNQIGFTTLPQHARSTRYATDVAKMLMIPIFHVQGEDPEAAVHVAKLASSYRMEFGKDVVIDLICYRRYGHNEGDEPYFTQPQMYERIRHRPPLHELYAHKLLEQGIVQPDQIEHIANGISMCLEEGFKAAQENPRIFPRTRFYENWEGFHGTYSHDPFETGVPHKRLINLARSVNMLPDNIVPHPKLARLLEKRLESIETGEGIDWANAETLALASLLVEECPIRFSGQDSVRGTFSQRHCVIYDTQTEHAYIPLNHLSENQAQFQIYNSMLSEEAVLGFEYGYSLAQPQGLVMWEAQFGDFANTAQAIIDVYIASGETKWQRLSGLVMLLPHGLEGLGPEHSSARLERYLQLCADDNMQVCYPTTPAQYFHCLRRQSLRQMRKPLIMMTPKSLLRHPLAVSSLFEFTSGHFSEILDDPASVEEAQQVIFCSGKIYYALIHQREELKKTAEIAIIRIEQLYPFPQNALLQLIAKYFRARRYLWVQEEPQNMGAWSFLRPHLQALTGTDVTYIGRKAAASPATGFANIYRQEQAAIITEALEPLRKGAKS